MAKKVLTHQLIWLILVVLILNLCWAGKSVAEDPDYRGNTRGLCCPPQVYITIDPDNITLGPGENATIDIYVGTTSYYGDPYNIYLWPEGVPWGWKVKLNQSYFHQIHSSAKCTLNISIPNNTPVGISRVINITGFWRSGDQTGWVGYLSSRVTRYFKFRVNIKGPDLIISDTNIEIVNDSPVEGQTIGFMATIHNIGNTPASNISVRFMVNDNQVGKVQYITILMPGKSLLVFGSWEAVPGNHTVTVEIDYKDSIQEYSETNNIATTTVSVEEGFTKWVRYFAAASIVLCIPALVILGNKRIAKG